jgi:hypothetical protein
MIAPVFCFLENEEAALPYPALEREGDNAAYFFFLAGRGGGSGFRACGSKPI